MLFVGDHNVTVIVIVSLALAGHNYLLMFYDGSPWWAVALCHHCHASTVVSIEHTVMNLLYVIPEQI